ncbi:MAG: hypothetical protein ABIK83_01080 [Candidatus Zixiibacteriota bacterium]
MTSLTIGRQELLLDDTVLSVSILAMLTTLSASPIPVRDNIFEITIIIQRSHYRVKANAAALSAALAHEDVRPPQTMGLRSI